MAQLKRYFAPQIPDAGGMVTLTDEEAHHLLHVMRASVGDEIQLFDGAGALAPARVAALRRRDAES